MQVVALVVAVRRRRRVVVWEPGVGRCGRAGVVEGRGLSVWESSVVVKKERERRAERY